jgi:hypothetical protein
MGHDLIPQAFFRQLDYFFALAPKSRLAFTIGCLSHYDRIENFYTTPVRTTNKVTYMGVIVRDVETAVKIAQIIDGKVAHVFVDSEKKIQKEDYGANDVGNIEKAICGVLQNSALLSYKANDLTVHAADSLIRVLTPNLTGSKVAVIGVSNIGIKLGLSLLERGNSVCLYSRNEIHSKTVADFLNKIKMRNLLVECSFASSPEMALSGSELIVTSGTEKSAIGIEHLNSMKSSPRTKEPILIDVGKGGFKDDVIEANYIVHRVDVGDQISREIDNLLELESQCKKMAYRILTPDIHLVRRGVVGKKGDYVVDDTVNPQRILGKCDGIGNLISVDEEESDDILKRC